MTGPRPDSPLDALARNSWGASAKQDKNPLSQLAQQSWDEPRRIRTASPSIADIEHRESYNAIRKRNLLDSVKDQEAIERAENPDLFDRYGEALKQTVMHPVETGKALAKGIIEPPSKILAPSKAAAASLNAPGSQPRQQLAARFGPSYLTDPEPFGKGVTGEERAGAVAQTAAMALAPGASLGRTLGMGALAGAASAPDDPLLGAAVGSTLGTAGRTLRRAPKASAYEPPPAPKVTGVPAAAPAPFPPVPTPKLSERALTRIRTERLGLGGAQAVGAPVRRPGPKTANEPGTPAAEAVPYSTKGAAVRRPANPFDDLAIKEAETPPVTSNLDPPGTDAVKHSAIDPRQPQPLIYRGITAEEAASVAQTGEIKSRGDFSHSSEGTSFAQDFPMAESAVNFGRTAPGQTGKPTYVLEVRSGPDIAVDPRDFNPKATGPVPADRIARAWRFDPDGTRTAVELVEGEWRERKPSAEAVPFAMGGQESRIPADRPPTPRGPRTEPTVPEVTNAAEYPAGVPRAMDPKTLANAVKRTGLTDESAETARKQILESGYQPVRVTFAEQAKVAEQLAGTLGVDVKALRPDLAKRMSVPDMYARITRASTNVKLIEALSKEVTEGTLSPDEAGNLTHALEKLEAENANIYGDVLAAGSQKGRELGAMRMIARLSTDPAVWEVQAMRKLGGKPLSDQVRGTVRRMAADVAAACAL